VCAQYPVRPNGNIHIQVDGGYNKKESLITRNKWSTARKDVDWGEWLESVRKKIECAFGK
jgi:hypothetical protein